MNNKNLMILGTLGAIFIGLFAPLIAYINKDKLQTPDRLIITAFLNFELSLLIICVVLNFIPLFGQIICAIMCVINIIYSIVAYNAAKTGNKFNPPYFYEFVK